uniref:Putative ATP-dependent helicase C29A10.10c n=1 Tax=Bactrocera latifrons TaxID=174628 RepID=A0A0K8U466_BACLA
MADRSNRVLSSWFLERKVIGDRIRLYIGVTAVGRTPGSAICILDSHYVSRKHAEITVDIDEKIVLKDLGSINGTFVNGSKVHNSEIQLKANDCIGIGVTDDTEPSLKHPIYKLIYAPMPKVTTLFKEPIGIEATQVIVVDGESTNENSNIVQEVKKDEPKCPNVSTTAAEMSSSLLPSVKTEDSLTNIRKPNDNLKISTPLSKVPMLYYGDVIVLSDDEEDKVLPNKEEKKITEESASSKDKSKETDDENIFNKPDPVLSKTSSSNKPTASASASGTMTDKKDNASSTQLTNEKVVIHEPIAPDIKREFVNSCYENVVDIFGGTDEVILQSVKAINPLVYKKLNDDKALDKPLCNGDTIDLLSDNEDDEGHIAQNVECFGELVPADAKEAHTTKKTTNSKENVEKGKQADDSTCTTGQKSPNLFDNSLNSSKNSVDEQRSVNIDEQNVEKEKEDSVNTAEELAAFVDMDDDMLFSQILINDIKSEMMCDHSEEDLAVEDEPAYDVHKDNCPDDFANIQIKKEPIDDDSPDSKVISTKAKAKSNEIENDVWITIDDDDEYYDEEFEHKVSDWSTKLLSQKMNMSQVFDFQHDKGDDSDDNVKKEEHELMYESDDLDFFNEELVDDVVATLAKKNGEIKNDVNSSELARSLMHSDVTNYDAGSSKQLLQQKKHIVKEHLKKTQLERKSSSESTEAPTDAEAATSSKSAQRNERISSSDGKEKERHDKRGLVKPVKRLHHPPSVIDAPCLPIHKGKHRGVSAEIRPTMPKEIHKKMREIKGQYRDERYRDELKRKWLEKPSDERRRESEKKRKIKESRKEKLKEIADKQLADSSKEALLKRKHSTTDLEGVEKKKAKVKITATNRGALLAEDISAPKKFTNTYRIPKTKRPCSDVTTTTATESTPASTAVTAAIPKPNHTTIVDAFAQEMKKVDQIIRRRLSSSGSVKSVSRSSSLDENRNATTTVETAKPLNAAVRRSNKITFASMQKNYTESRMNQQLLQKITNHRSCLIDVVYRNANAERPKKHVRFNETPIIHYIERVSGANKRVDCKDILPSPTCADRAQMVRQTYAMIDKTAQIISQILGWSNEWLINRNAQVDAASDILLPMPNQFNSFNHYKSIIIPLMKLEFISMLERDNTRCKAKPFTLAADQVTPYLDRYIILGRCTGVNNSDTKCELVVLEWGKFKTFAYMSSKRVGFSNFTIVYEVLAKELADLEDLRANLKNPITVRPMVDIVRVEFGAFNAVYQLEQSPLLKQILDPMELCKIKPYPKCNTQYNGCDELNHRQKHVLLRTYRHATEPTPNITLIQGPPGTGKSCVIANLVHQLLYGNEVRILDQKVLVCAQSNAAVDVIAEKLFDMSQTKSPDKMFRLIRFGLLERINPKVRHATLPKIIERNQIRKLKATCKNLQIDHKVDIKEYLRNEILQIEADIEHMKMNNVKNTVQEEVLLEKQRQIQLMRNIVNGVLRPEDENSLYNWHLKHANVVCTTLSSCVKLSKYVNYFDACIIDEATQCTEPWTLMPLKFGINTLVLVGDTQQLPATVLSKKASDFGLGTSLFTRIQRCIESVTLKTVANADKGKNVSSLESTDIIFSLQTQYRMHPEICKWPNSYFYKNELIDDAKTHQFKTPLKPFSVLNLTYTQNDNCHRGQIANELEAQFVARLVKTLDGYIPMKYNTYGVITPYAQQRVALEKALRTAGYSNVMVNTIDSYQGMERDVIIISNARTTGIGFLANYQRLNVALTRPKKCLILCGNFKNLETVPAWRSLLSSARERKLYHELSPNCMDDMHRTVIPKIKVSKTNTAATEATTTATTKEVTTVATTTKQSEQ